MENKSYVLCSASRKIQKAQTEKRVSWNEDIDARKRQKMRSEEAKFALMNIQEDKIMYLEEKLKFKEKENTTLREEIDNITAKYTKQREACTHLYRLHNSKIEELSQNKNWLEWRLDSRDLEIARLRKESEIRKLKWKKEWKTQLDIIRSMHVENEALKRQSVTNNPNLNQPFIQRDDVASEVPLFSRDSIFELEDVAAVNVTASTETQLESEDIATVNVTTLMEIQSQKPEESKSNDSKSDDDDDDVDLDYIIRRFDRQSDKETEFCKSEF